MSSASRRPEPPFREPSRRAEPVPDRAAPRLDARAAARLEHTRRLARLLDGAFRVPGTNFRFGIEPLISLFPWAGDVVGGLLSFTVIWNANRLGISPVVQFRMALNVLLDVAVGVVPVVGDVLDFFFKPNAANLKLLERHLAEGDTRARPSDWIFVLGTLLLGAIAIAIPLVAAALILWWVGRTVSGLSI